MERSSGILLPISALPSPYGIGSLGQAAYDFADFLHAAGQRVWQLLPLSPTSFGDSPYQSFSAFAGNPYFIDLDLLRRDGLLTAQECADALAPAGKIDYAALYETRLPLLQRAAERWDGGEELAHFEREQGFWLADYALFMAAKRHFSMRPWTQWEDGALRLREPQKLEEYGNLLAGDILFFKKLQCLFFRQWRALREYCTERGLQLFGDLPIYVALDSADVWAAPEDFLLDENRQPTAVAGVPPDAFTAEGQLWGNPLYNWEKMERDGFGWWIRRIGAARALFDLLRIDHFRGFESYWAVPAGAKTAREGAWRKGPGEKLVCALRSWFADFPLIAEDLGELTPAVRELLEKSGLPGMRVLEFAFDAEGDSPYQMHNYVKNCVCYLGTHDNAPLLAWREEADEAVLRRATQYLGLSEAEGFVQGFVRGGMGSVAALFVAQLQDYLLLGADSRTNTPGSAGGNWRWRLLPNQATPELAAKIRAWTRRYGRI